MQNKIEQVLREASVVTGEGVLVVIGVDPSIVPPEVFCRDLRDAVKVTKCSSDIRFAILFKTTCCNWESEEVKMFCRVVVEAETDILPLLVDENKLVGVPQDFFGVGLRRALVFAGYASSSKRIEEAGGLYGMEFRLNDAGVAIAFAATGGSMGQA